MSALLSAASDPGDTDVWHGDATSVVEFLRPLREQLDAPGVLEVCVNRPEELLVETIEGWRTIAAPELVLEMYVDEYDGWLDDEEATPPAPAPPLDLPTAPRRIKRPQ